MGSGRRSAEHLLSLTGNTFDYPLTKPQLLHILSSIALRLTLQKFRKTLAFNRLLTLRPAKRSIRTIMFKGVNLKAVRLDIFKHVDVRDA